MTDLDKLFEAIKSLKKQKRDPKAGGIPEFKTTYLIAGLGNPGREFRDTRHNIGFLLVDKIAATLELDFSRTQAKALITDGIYQNNKIILVKPQTYMNRSGHAIHSLLSFYKVDLENMLVAYDDVDLPFGAIRLRPSGGSAGHKGVQSIIEQLGSDQFPRLRLGVGRPPGFKQAANYVLKPFNKEEDEFLDPFLEQASEAALAVTTNGLDYAMTNYNRNDWL